METILNMQQVSKHFDGIVAVDNVSMAVPTGTITGIFGDNGAGKSSLFNLISGFEKPDSGKILFQNIDITHISVLKRARLGMGRLFQIPRIFSDITVFDNLLAASKNQKGHHPYNYVFNSGAIKKENEIDCIRANKILEQFTLSEKSAMKAYELSVGEKKLLSLGSLLMNDARLLLLDEPFAGINEVLIDHLKKMLVLIKQQGVTLLIIEHNKLMIEEIADNCFEMRRGKIVESKNEDNATK